MGEDGADDGPEQLWIYGINDAKVEPDLSAGYPKSGQFTEDFLQCCRANNIVPHPAFANASDTAVIGSGILVDRVSMRIVRSLLPSCQALELVKFTNCKLDAEMLNWLVDALSEEKCTIKTLILDWNPLELPLQIPEEFENNIEKIEELEQIRQRSQMERDVQLWCEKVFEKTGVKDIVEVVDLILSPIASLDIEKKRKVPAVQGMTDTIDWEQFCFYFGDRICVQLDAELFQSAFNYFDGPLYGGGEKKFTLELVKTVVDKFVVFNEPEYIDPIGDVYKRILVSTFLENVSLRSSKISRLEMPEIRDGLRVNRFLRQLNLYGNLIGDKAVEDLAVAFMDNQTLQVLGLGNNKITEKGLKCLAESFGATVIEDRTEADERIREQTNAKPPAPSVDGAGNERWQRQGQHVDGLEPMLNPDGTESGKFYWFRNKSLQVLNLANNEVRDLRTTKAILQLGNPTSKLILKGNPVADRLRNEGFKPPEEGAVTGWQVEF